MKTAIIVTVLFLTSFGLSAQSIVGKWTTIDDTSGKAKALVEIYERGGKYYGKILENYPDPGESKNPMCDACEGDLEGMPIIGMEILKDLVRDDDEWDDGTILDPENGKLYDCKVWLEEGNLMLRGYIAFFYRTQTWLPYEG